MIRTRLIAAILAAGALTGMAGMTASAAPTPVDTGVTSEKKKDAGVPEEAVKLLAAELDLTIDRARQVFRDLEKVKARGDEILDDRAFVAIADGLGLTPEQLLTVLREIKQALAKPGSEEPKPKPEPKDPSAK
ncbi:MAG: hypothetical protein HOV94_37230 [Saccharothrix sp.]|nr:hypothetical protein [Saccharothrix sp.]